MTSSKQLIIEQLNRYVKRYPEETHTVTQVRQFLDQTPPEQWGSHPSKHITGSAWLVSTDGQKALLTLHKKQQCWFQLGGHMDQHEGHPMQTAWREAIEESGIAQITPLNAEIFHLGIYDVPAYQQQPQHQHIDFCYLFQATAHNQQQISAESLQLAWHNATQIRQCNSLQALRPFVQKWQNHTETVQSETTNQ